MKILKRNQIIISVIALMLITVGYMNYTSNITATLETGSLMDSEKMAGIGDARLVNSNNVVENTTHTANSQQVQNSESDAENNKQSSTNDTTVDIQTAESSTNSEHENASNDNNTSASSVSTNTETQTTSANSYGADYFVSSKLERDKMYSQMVETYQGLLESGNISAEQKSISTQEITSINNRKNSIMIAENLIKNLGFEDVVIFVNDNSISVIVKAEKLQEADIAQIQNIVCREIGVEADMIHISLK